MAAAATETLFHSKHFNKQKVITLTIIHVAQQRHKPIPFIVMLHLFYCPQPHCFMFDMIDSTVSLFMPLSQQV